MSRTADPEMRSRILDAADRLLARHGFRRMTIEAVAKEAGVGKGSVYLHFTSKEDVALSCIDRMAGRVATELERLAQEKGTAFSRLRAMLRARVLDRFDYARRHAPSIDEKLAIMRAALLERRARHFAREAATLACVVAEGCRSGELRAVTAERTGRALVAATNSLLPYSLSVRELGRRTALAKRLDELIDLLLAGLTRGALPGPTRRSNTRRVS
ncbi:MAG: TetR/AcrR family transcriptional regulator [Candidatus Eiseniibacteriota bacterium]